MSIFSGLKTFFEKVGAEIEKLFGGSGIEQKVYAVITYVSPLVNMIIGLVDPAVAPLIASVIRTVQADLATISVTVQEATVAAGTAAGQAVVVALNSVKTNLAGLLAMAEVKNSAKIATITTTVNGIVGEVDAILGELSPSPATSS